MARGMNCLARRSSAAVRIALLTVFATVFGLSVAAEAAIAVHTTDFISNAQRTNFNGFEAMPTTGLYSSRYYTGGSGPYIEGGVRVQQVNVDPGNHIWASSAAPMGFEGQNAWFYYQNSQGFTRITMADGSDFQNVGFLRASGGEPTLVFYELYKNGALVHSGSVSHTPFPQYLGFSGGGFDRIDLRDNGGVGFGYSPSLNYLAIDSIEVMQTVLLELSVSKSGTGAGTVTSNVGGINCGATCSAPLPAGTIVTLAATPTGGSTFAGWSGGGCSGPGNCVVTVEAAKTVNAQFTAPAATFPLSVSKPGSGTGTVTSNVGGINCGATCGASFQSGTVVTLVATPIGGSTFAGWSGGGCSGTSACVVTVDAAKTVNAQFNAAPATFAFNVTKSGTGTGTVSSNVGGINCGATCSANVAVGTVVILTVTPDGGSTFAGWSGAGCSGPGNCVVTVEAAKTVNAQFTAPAATFPLSVSKSGSGTGTVTSNVGGINCGATCSANVAGGTVVTLTATPTGGSTFAGWSGGGCSGIGACVVTVTTGKTVTAAFTANTAPTTVNLNQHGLTGSWYEPASSGQGFAVQIIPDQTPGHGTAFVSWFTFDTVIGGADRQRWYTLQGPVVTGQSNASLTIYQNTGGNFNAPPATNPQPVGTATLSFETCSIGELSYTFTDGSGRAGTIPLVRLLPNVTCSVTTPHPTNTDFAFSGSWYAGAATDGQGFTAEVAPNSSAFFLSWFTYAPSGANAGAAGQRWYTAQGAFTPGLRTIPVQIYEHTGGKFDTSTPPSQGTVQVGTGTMTFQSCSAATFSYNFFGGTSNGSSGTITLGRLGPVPPGCAQ